MSKSANRLATVPLSELRILEIGDFPYFKVAAPDNTRFIAVGMHEQASKSREDYTVFAAHRAPAIARALRDPDLDLIVVHFVRDHPWSLRSLRNGLRIDRKGEWRLRYWRSFGALMPLLGTTAPMIGLDLDDSPFLPRHMVPIAQKSVLTFKRELPTDRWQLLAFHFGEHELPPVGVRQRSAAMQAMLAKIEPISLGVKKESEISLPKSHYAKKTDVFFAGGVSGNATTRAQSLSEVRRLANAGYVIDTPERLSPEEFFKRCAEAWLVLSPRGLGWDCYRHYEAAACRSVPLMSQCVIERYAPLLDGVHAFYYDAVPGSLSKVAIHALADKARLTQIAAAAHQHTRQFHTQDAICQHMVTRTAAELAATARSTSEEHVPRH
jgi:hypothetical protein